MSAPVDRWGDRLPRRLGLWSAVAVVVGSTIGGGIFRTPAIIALRVPSPWPMLGVWVLGGALALCGALTYAELGALFPRSGGVFVYIREGFGRLPAFLFGWTELTLIRASALGAIATPFAEYLLRLLGYDPAAPGVANAVHYVAALAIALTATLNYVGIRWSALLLNASTATKYGALVLLVLVAVVLGKGNVGNFTAPGTHALSGGLFGLSLVSVLWAYDGWGDLSFVGGEVRDPERNLPRALVIGTVAIVLIYLLVNAAYLYLIPIEQMARSPLVAADAAQILVGRAGVEFVSLVVMIATFSTLVGSLLTAPRIFFAMADDGLFFRAVARVHPRFETPSVAIVLTAALGIAFVLARSFEELADQFVVAIFPFYALAAASVFVLRRRLPNVPRPVRVWGYPVVPWLFVLASLVILGNALREHPGATGLAFGGILLGVPVYYVWARRNPAKSAAV
jgi:amino acid transporter